MSSPQALSVTKQQVSIKLLTDLSGTLVLLFTLIPGLIYVFLFFTNNPILQEDPKISTFHNLLQTFTAISFVAGVLMLLAAIQTILFKDEKFIRTIPTSNAWGRNPFLKKTAQVWEFLSDLLMTIPYGLASFGRTQEQINLDNTPARQFLIIQSLISGGLSLIFADIFRGSWLPINPFLYLGGAWLLSIILFIAGSLINKTKE